MSQITLRQIENQMMAASDSTNHSIVIGTSPDEPGMWVGVKPSDLLLISVAACSAYDVVEILNKRREIYCNLVIICDGEQQPDPPYAYNKINLSFRLTGSVDPLQFRRAIDLSIHKYCSVVNSLRPDILITSDFVIFPDQANAHDPE